MAAAQSLAATNAKNYYHGFCDWENAGVKGFMGCQYPTLTPINCQYPGCTNLVHHLCQIACQTILEDESDSISTYCTLHCPVYSAYDKKVQQRVRSDMQRHSDMAVGGGETLSELDEILFGSADGDQNDMVITDDSVTVISEALGPRLFLSGDDCDTDDDEFSNYCGDSDDAGSEAELFDAATEFHNEENLIDDVYGVSFELTGTPFVIPGTPLGWIPPGPPMHWEYDPPDGVPPPEDTDNPGGWNYYSFAPKFKAGKGGRKYVGHESPAGAIVLPADDDGNRMINGWKLHYQGWKADSFDKTTYVRDDAAYGNLKPKSRAGFLDADVLRKHGLTADRMAKDPFFFFQLLFPICNPKQSGIKDDHRMPYFTHASTCTNIYATAQGGGSGLGHSWNNATVDELVKWTGIPIYNGALDGNAGSIHARWDKSDARYSAEMSKTMTKSRFKEIKRFFKLNNNFLHTKKKGDEGYDPCVKFDLPYKVLIHNMNNVTGQADLDCTLDESTWGFGGYGGDCVSRLINKPVNRGMF